MCDPLRNDPDGVYRRGELPETGCRRRAKIGFAVAAFGLVHDPTMLKA
jgi:hypothetical protein